MNNQGKNVTLNITTKRSDEEINLITDAVCYAQEGEIRFEYSESLAAKEDTGYADCYDDFSRQRYYQPGKRRGGEYGYAV